MSNNGHSPTAQTIEGVTVDLNRVSQREFARLTKAIDLAGDDVNQRIELSGELVEKIVTAWPFEMKVSKDAYCELGLMDSRLVDEVMTQLMNEFSEKKLVSPSTLPENTDKA